MALHISGLFVYPVKGCRGISLREASIAPTGFAYDRHWLVVSEDSGRFVSQRNDPKLALVKTALPEEALHPRAGKLPAGAALTLDAPGQGILQIPLQPAKKSESELKDCICWGWKGPARDEGDEAAAYLTEYLGRPTRLVRYAGDAADGTPDSNPKRRIVDPEFAPPGTETAFSDEYPFLLATEGSLADLNARLDPELPMDRFRPNVVVEGALPWEEDTWSAVQLPNTEGTPIKFSLVKPCGRCKVTTTDQETAVQAKEPLVALRAFRSGKVLGWTSVKAWRNEVFFGWNLVTSAMGTIAVGAPVTPVQRIVPLS